MKYVDFRPAKLVKGSRWYVYYYYRVPPELRHQYGGKTWERFRVNEGLNRYKDDEFASLLVEAVNENLKKGFNPFFDDLLNLEITGEPKKDVTVKLALEKYIDQKSKEGLDPSTIQRYKAVCELLNTYFVSRGLHSQPVSKIKKQHIKTMLEHYKQQRGWSNRQYNNIKGYTFGVFEFLRKEEIIPDNPVELIPSLKSKSKKHKYFDKTLFPKVNQIIQDTDPYMWYMAQFVYYLCVRSSKELRLLKVGDIMEGGELFLFRNEVAKSGRDDIIPVDRQLQEVFKEMGLFTADPNHYIFTIDRKPGPNPVSARFMQNHFAKIRAKAGLTKDWTLYGYKHTRAVHLLLDGVKLSDVSKLLRHNDIATTANYARDLGVDFDPKDIMSKGRKI